MACKKKFNDFIQLKVRMNFEQMRLFVFHSFLMQISGICYIERRRRKMFSKVIVDDSQSDLVEVHRFTFVAVI